MPAQPAWFHRLNEILEQIRDLPVSHLDRLAVQKLFGVRERRARQIMAGLRGLQVGNAFAVERTALVARLESIAAGDRFQTEMARRTRMVEKLNRTRRELAARRVLIPTPPPSPARVLGDGIELLPNELRIRFQSAEELAARLFQLSQNMATDWVAFTDLVEKGLPCQGAPEPME